MLVPRTRSPLLIVLRVFAQDVLQSLAPDDDLEGAGLRPGGRRGASTRRRSWRSSARQHPHHGHLRFLARGRWRPLPGRAGPPLGRFLGKRAISTWVGPARLYADARRRCSRLARQNSVSKPTAAMKIAAPFQCDGRLSCLESNAMNASDLIGNHESDHDHSYRRPVRGIYFKQASSDPCSYGNSSPHKGVI